MIYHSLRKKEEEFKDNAILDEPASLSYEPLENLKGDYPEVGYSFELPELRRLGIHIQRIMHIVIHLVRHILPSRLNNIINC